MARNPWGTTIPLFPIGGFGLDATFGMAYEDEDCKPDWVLRALAYRRHYQRLAASRDHRLGLGPGTTLPGTWQGAALLNRVIQGGLDASKVRNRDRWHYSREASRG